MILTEENPTEIYDRIHSVKVKALEPEGGPWEEDYEPNYDDLELFVTAKEGKTIIGTGAYREPNGPVMEHIETDGSDIEIKNMHVLPEWHKEGIGTSILEYLEKDAVEKGYSRSVLEIIEEQESAHYFYPEMGYEVIEEKPIEVNGTEYKVTFMANDLTGRKLSH